MNREEVFLKIRKDKKRLTKAKKDVIDIFLSHDELMDVKDIKEKLNMADLSTVYRIVDYLLEIDFIEEIQKQDKRWYRKKQDYKSHRHFIVCEKCGKKQVLDFCPFEDIQDKVGGYEIKKHKFELIGLCEKCKKGD